MEEKKGLIAVAILAATCLAVMILGVSLGIYEFNKLQSDWYPESTIPIVYEDAAAYFRGLGFSCGEISPLSQPAHQVDCDLTESGGRRVLIAMDFLRDSREPFSISAHIYSEEDLPPEKPMIKEYLSKIARIPYRDARPDTAELWVRNCLDLPFQELMGFTLSFNNIEMRITFARIDDPVLWIQPLSLPPAE